VETLHASVPDASAPDKSWSLMLRRNPLKVVITRRNCKLPARRPRILALPHPFSRCRRSGQQAAEALATRRMSCRGPAPGGVLGQNPVCGTTRGTHDLVDAPSRRLRFGRYRDVASVRRAVGTNHLDLHHGTGCIPGRGQQYAVGIDRYFDMMADHGANSLSRHNSDVAFLAGHDGSYDGNSELYSFCGVNAILFGRRRAREHLHIHLLRFLVNSRRYVMIYRYENVLDRFPSCGRGSASLHPRQAEPGGFIEKPSHYCRDEGRKTPLISGADGPFGR